MRFLLAALLLVASWAPAAAQGTCVTVLVILDSLKYPNQPATRVTVPCPIVAPVHDTVLRVDTIIKRDSFYRVDTIIVHDSTPAPIPPVGTPSPVAPSPYTLPLVWLNTAAPAAPALGGSIIRVAQGGNLQAALDQAQPGDVVELAAGSVFTGNFILKNKGAGPSNWITIRPSNYASLPLEGQRMTPTIAAALKLPRIQTSSGNPSLGFAAGAHHVRIIGIEISLNPSLALTYALVSTESSTGQKVLADVPSFITLDRVYVHGSSTQTVRRCVALNSASSAVIDSWMSDCHELGSDSQAIAVWNGPGPFKIVNNYLEAAGENLMFGGNDPSIQGLTPSDIEVRRNHFFKQPSWKGKWTVKNLLEIKHAQRVLIEGNILENSWVHAQNGVGVVMKSVNQNGSCTWCVTQDVTYRLNVLRHVGAGYNIGASPDNALQTVHARRLAITDNVASAINTDTLFNGDGRAFLLDGDLREVQILRNTTVSETHAFVMGGQPSVSVTVSNNLFGSRVYGLIGTGLNGGAAWAFFAPTGTFTGNILMGDPSLSAVNFGTLSTYPPGNTFRSGYLVTMPGYPGDLTSSVAGVGADVKAVNAATAGVIVP